MKVLILWYSLLLHNDRFKYIYQDFSQDMDPRLYEDQDMVVESNTSNFSIWEVRLYSVHCSVLGFMPHLLKVSK